MSGTYVTEFGFIKKTLPELKLEIEAFFQGSFGDDIDLDPEAPFGQIVGILSQRDANLWDALEELYLSRDPDQATGVSLTKIARETGTTRLSAAPTVVEDVILYGGDATVVLAGKKIKKENDSSRPTPNFLLNDDVTISLNNVKAINLEIPDSVVVSEDYSVTFVEGTYTYTAEAGDTKDDIIDELVILTEAVDGVASLNLDTVLSMFFTVGGRTVSFSSNIEAVSIGTEGDFTCDTEGVVTVPSNVLTVIVTPVSGWDFVNNPIAGEVGRTEESDESLRVRREQELNLGLATDAAIVKAVREVENVIDANVVSNRLDTVDGEGRPGHSFETVVSGGDDDEIAQAIFDSSPGGIQYYGVAESGTATDEYGDTFEIPFSRASPTYIWVRVSRDYNTEEAYPTDGDDLIKVSILSYAETFLLDGIDIIRQRLSTPIYDVPGVGDIIVELAETSTPGGTPTYSETNITIGQRVSSEFSLTRIIVKDI